jgi:hypothetical protein
MGGKNVRGVRRNRVRHVDDDVVKSIAELAA